jgi:hypothetical protein
MQQYAVQNKYLSTTLCQTTWTEAMLYCMSNQYPTDTVHRSNSPPPCACWKSGVLRGRATDTLLLLRNFSFSLQLAGSATLTKRKRNIVYSGHKKPLLKSNKLLNEASFPLPAFF